MNHKGHAVLQALAGAVGAAGEILSTPGNPWAHLAWLPSVIVGLKWLRYTVNTANAQDGDG